MKWAVTLFLVLGIAFAIFALGAQRRRLAADLATSPIGTKTLTGVAAQRSESSPQQLTAKLQDSKSERPSIENRVAEQQRQIDQTVNSDRFRALVDQSALFSILKQQAGTRTKLLSGHVADLDIASQFLLVVAARGGSFSPLEIYSIDQNISAISSLNESQRVCLSYVHEAKDAERRLKEREQAFLAETLRR